MVKGIKITIIFILISLSSFWVGYLITNKNSTIDLTKSKILIDRFTGTPSATSKPKKTIAITLEPTISSVLNGKTIRYVASNGQILEIDIKNLTHKTISNNIFNNILGVLWSPNANNLIFLVNGGEGNKFLFLYPDKGVVKNLDHKIITLAFSPDGDKIAYIEKNGDSSSVIIQHLDSVDPQKIANIRIRATALNWIDNETLYLKSSSEDNIYSSFFINFSGGLAKALENKVNLEEIWSGDKQKFIFSSLINGSDNISIFNILNKTEMSLDIAANADKCTWSIDNKHVFCAIPKNQSGQEDLFVIDVNTKEKKLVTSLESYLIAEKLFVSEIDNYAIIQNSLDHKLYRVYLENL